MGLINIVRALEDDRFIWRVKGAVIQTAVAKMEDADPQFSAYAKAVLSNPLQDAGKAPAIVVANPAILDKVDVNEYNTVSTERIEDNDILYVVNENWDVLSEGYGQVEAPTP